MAKNCIVILVGREIAELETLPARDPKADRDLDALRDLLASLEAVCPADATVH